MYQVEAPLSPYENVYFGDVHHTRYVRSPVGHLRHLD